MAEIIHGLRYYFTNGVPMLSKFRLLQPTLFILALALASVAILTAFSRAGVKRTESAHPPLGDFLEVDGIRLHYLSRGEGPALVLVHGASSTLREFTSILPSLSRSHRVIAFDRPGFGYSARPPGPSMDPAKQARLLHHALQKLGIVQPILVGHSWSGSVVLSYMLDHSNDLAGAVLIAGVTHPWEGGVHWLYHVAGTPVVGSLVAHTVLYPLGRAVLNQIATRVFSPSPIMPGHITRTGAVLALRPETFLNNAEDVKSLSDYLRTIRPRYRRIRLPLLLISGDSDSVVPAQHHALKLVNEAPNAELAVFANAGHAVHHTHGEAVAQAIRGFAGKAYAIDKAELSMKRKQRNEDPSR
ncbi:MAG: alpha/beta fold hydrolase [Gammaproteobacteria bacterium]